jgi:hypothetical protein
MPAHIRIELWLIALLAPCVAALAFWYVPASITEHGGFGSGSEMSPRFTPYLIAFLMAAAMAFRLGQIGWAMAQGRLAGLHDDLAGNGTPTETRRGLLLNAMALAYGFVLMPLAGFYAASFMLVGALVWLLGERRVWMAGLAAGAVAVFTYLLFEEVLSVRLPKGLLGAAMRGWGL